MAFGVNTAILRGLPALLARLAADARVGAAHLRQRAEAARPAAPPGSLLVAVRPRHERIVRQVEEHLTAVRAAAQGASAAVAAAIDHYELAADATVPGADPVDGGYDDQTQPTAHLTEPAARPDDGEFDFDLWPDLLNPAGACRRAIWDVTARASELGLMERPVDVHDELVRPVSGDWAALLGWAATYRGLSGAYTDMGRNLAAADHVTARIWAGDTAAGCREFLGRFDAALTDAAARLEELAKRYEEAGHEVLTLSHRLAGLVAESADQAAVVLLRLEDTGDDVFAELYALHQLIYGAMAVLAEIEQTVARLTEALDEARTPTVPELPAIPALVS